ncbi:hypothetical protein C8034_v008330 [Colletotrichum sidae]|uniref:Chitinase n=1 Tax=Colletotrichum sidae TaxID=1347389 RepID=A0A4R8TSE8_9PEZI|nr:hypothetical protein C8034_v008330 [Colletotrichum sidae]
MNFCALSSKIDQVVFASDGGVAAKMCLCYFFSTFPFLPDVGFLRPQQALKGRKFVFVTYCIQPAEPLAEDLGFDRKGSLSGILRQDAQNVQIPFPTYSFDGVDWDWECPSAEDHGGVAADFANTIFLAEPGAVSGTRDITVAMPSPSFSLDDPSCNEPNGRILASDTATESYDEKAGVKWMHWNKDLWVSYDDGTAMQQEMNLASRRCLVGVIKWSIEQDNTEPSMDDMLGIGDANGIPNSLKQEYKEKAAVM